MTATQKLARELGQLVVGKWKVESKSNPGTYHLVKKRSNGEFECDKDCIGYGVYGHCRHIKKVKKHLNSN